jgi:hypothetical protein
MDQIPGIIVGVFMAIGGLAIILQKEADIGGDEGVVLVKGCFKNIFGAIFLILGLAFICHGLL